MNVQGYQKLTLLDFPGVVACTVFTGGCNLRCPFCHNAGLVLTPHEADSMEPEVLEYLGRRKGLLEGVCITGGEPLLQPDLEAFVQKVKALGYRVKLDTNGSLPDRLQAILDTGLIDYVAMDVKSSPNGYRKATGASIDPTVFEKSIRLLQNSGIAHEFRTTAVKGIHTVEDFTEIGKWLASDSPYFIQTFVNSQNLIGSGCDAFSEDETQALLEAVQPYLPLAKLRGQS
ncbi:MAG: anaerobic ribonucleoside-triphosphate reductase activating protein [Ruminococcaceae bacterium]|nr:anaerobic ribonucleoside-triphosphate reductase activating protein [Oscillospiraceae bacterium]